MSKLTLLEWSGKRREVRFVGFNREHTACFIRDDENGRRAITLHLPKAFGLRFRQNPVGKDGSPPIEINRAALHLPACFSSLKEKLAFDDPDSMEVQTAKIFFHELWKAVTPHKCWLESKDDKKLSKLLRDELDRLRRRHKIRQRETDKLIAALPPGSSNRADELRNMLRGEFTAPGVGENGAFKSISIFDTTLKMVRGGWRGLREKLLEQQWTEHFGLCLKDIPIETAAFHAWIERHACNARQTTTHANTRTVEIGIGLKLDPWQWEILEALVLYEIRFADGSRCWLDDIEERGVTDPQEVEDYDFLEEAAEVQGDEKLSLADVCRDLPVRWKGESKPMSKKGLQKLCENAHVPFNFPMRRSVVRKLDEHRKRQSRKRNERLKRQAAQATAQFDR